MSKSRKREFLKSVAQAEKNGLHPFRVDTYGIVRHMANEILGVPDHIKIGHKNGNPLDNRKCNLFIIDPERGSQNGNNNS